MQMSYTITNITDKYALLQNKAKEQKFDAFD